MGLLRKVERAYINFIWTGDIHKRKLFMVAWKKACRPFIKGGLGIRSLVRLNEVTNLKLMWSLRNSQESWAILLGNIIIRRNGLIKYHIFSTI